jgi:hypothetical protein
VPLDNAGWGVRTAHTRWGAKEAQKKRKQIDGKAGGLQLMSKRPKAEVLFLAVLVACLILCGLALLACLSCCVRFAQV